MSVGGYGEGGEGYWHLGEVRETAKLPTVLGAAPSRKSSQSLTSERLTNPALGSSVAILQTTVLALQKPEEGAWGMSPSLLPAPCQPSHMSVGRDAEGPGGCQQLQVNRAVRREGSWPGPPAPTTRDPKPLGAARSRPSRAHRAVVIRQCSPRHWAAGLPHRPPRGSLKWDEIG